MRISNVSCTTDGHTYIWKHSVLSGKIVAPLALKRLVVHIIESVVFCNANFSRQQQGGIVQTIQRVPVIVVLLRRAFWNVGVVRFKIAL